MKNNPKNQQAEKRCQQHGKRIGEDACFTYRGQPSEEKQMKIDEILTKKGILPGMIANDIKRAIKQLILERMPEKKKIDIEIPDTLHRNVGFNQALDDVTKVIEDIFDGRE